METRMLAAHIPLPLAEKLEELSEALDCSRDAIVAQAIAEWIDREEVRRLAVLRMLARADALFVAGSSLMVYSGFRFVRMAHEAGLPIAIVNRGRTRGDDLAELKIEEEIGSMLTAAITAIA